MKIALVSPYDFAYPSGVVNHISALAHHLTRLGQDVKIIAPASREVPGYGDRLISIGTPRPIPANGSIARITLSVNLSSLVREVLERERFDIIHLHEPLMPTLCVTVLRNSSSFVTVGTFHAAYKRPWYIPAFPLDGYNFGRPVSTMFLKSWAKNLDGRIAVSEPARDFVSRYFPGDYTVIPNGVDLEHFSPDAPPIPEFRDGKLNILFVGRLEKRKGFRYLLEAYQILKAEIRDSRLIVVGPGVRLRHKFEKQIQEEGIEDVVFAGFVSNDELPRYYRTADIFCAPATRCESFGIVLLEAMSTGTPIVASNVEGYATILTDGVEGIMVPPKDSTALAGALLSLARDEGMRRAMGRRGRARAGDFRWETVAQKILAYYQKVLETPRDRLAASPGWMDKVGII